MPTSLTKDQRNLLSRVTLEAREVAETAARAALENLAVHEGEYRGHMTVDQRQLRNRLRARGRALGDRLDQRSGTQTIDHLAESAAYEHWHRLLFTLFLAENHLLHTDEALGTVPVTLEECDELAVELGARDGFDLACRFASQTLPGIFRRDDPVLELHLARNHEVQLRQLLDRFPAELFRADDALGWTYQFWQAKRKKQVNEAGSKIGADELPAVTQLFTEDYMVEFLLHNSIGAWWAGKQGPVRADTEIQARAAVALSEQDGLPAITWDYLRFIQDDDGSWRPAAGTFKGWPKHAAEIRFLDPCMGSGHFLVFALPILARLRMEEEGLGAAEAVAAVLRDNLHGLEIDERCTQIAAFNVALTAWKLGGYQVLAPMHLACSGLAPHASKQAWMELADRATDFAPLPPERDLLGAEDNLFTAPLRAGMEKLYDLFEKAPVLGSLIDPRAIRRDMLTADFQQLQPVLEQALAQETNDSRRELAVTAQGLTKAAEILAGRFTLVATNVPYLARNKQSADLQAHCERYYDEAKSDLSNVFLERCLEFAAGPTEGAVQLVMPQNWLFLRAYKSQRRSLLLRRTWILLARLGFAAFDVMDWWAFGTILLSISTVRPRNETLFRGIDTSATRSISEKAVLLRSCDVLSVSQASQLTSPDHRVGLDDWSSKELLEGYASGLQGVSTSDNSRFRQQFWEQPWLLHGRAWFQGSVDEPTHFGGSESVILFVKACRAF